MHVLDEETRRFGRMLHYGGLLLAVVCASVGYSMLHAPTVQAISDITGEVDELILSVRNAPLIQEHHQKVSKTLAKVEEHIAALEVRVPQDAEAGEFLTQVTKIATEESFAIKNFKPEKQVNRDGYTEMEVTLKGQGSFASICTFADRLGKLTRLSKVKDLTLTGGENGTVYPVTATLVIYFDLRGKSIQGNGVKVNREVGRG